MLADRRRLQTPDADGRHLHFRERSLWQVSRRAEERDGCSTAFYMSGTFLAAAAQRTSDATTAASAFELLGHDACVLVMKFVPRDDHFAAALASRALWQSCPAQDLSTLVRSVARTESLFRWATRLGCPSPYGPFGFVWAELHGLQSKITLHTKGGTAVFDVNGKIARVLGPPIENGRQPVEIDCGDGQLRAVAANCKLIRPSNLRLLSEAELVRGVKLCATSDKGRGKWLPAEIPRRHSAFGMMRGLLSYLSFGEAMNYPVPGRSTALEVPAYAAFCPMLWSVHCPLVLFRVESLPVEAWMSRSKLSKQQLDALYTKKQNTCVSYLMTCPEDVGPTPMVYPGFVSGPAGGSAGGDDFLDDLGPGTVLALRADALDFGRRDMREVWDWLWAMRQDEQFPYDEITPEEFREACPRVARSPLLQEPDADSDRAQ